MSDTELSRTDLARLSAYARHLVRGGADAEDLVQEAVARYLETAQKGSRIGNREAYLVASMRNLFRDRCRRAAGGREVPLEPDLALPAADLLAARALEEALQTLPPAYAEAFLAHEVLGESYTEIAARQGVALGTVMSRLSRARKALRSRLRP